MSKYDATIVLDIDNTLTTISDNSVVERLKELTKACSGETYINTARHDAYCFDPKFDSTQFAKKINHYCWGTDNKLQRSYQNVAYTKVVNMNKILSKSLHTEKKRLVLFDDIQETVDAVKQEGYYAIKVNPGSGITHDDIAQAESYLSRNCRNENWKRVQTLMKFR